MKERADVLILAGSLGPVTRGLIEGIRSVEPDRRLRAAVHGRSGNLAPPVGVEWLDVAPERLDDTDELILLSTFNQRAIEAQIAAVRRARAAGVKSIRQVSIAGADPRSPVRFLRWLGMVEREILASGLPCSILRCAPFTQSLMLFFERDADGLALAGPFRDARFAWVDARDVGEIVARSAAGTPACTLTGPEALDFESVAGILARVLGEPVRYVDLTMPEALGVLAARGVPPDRIRGVREYWDYLVPGIVNAACCPTAAELLGRAPRTVATCAAECVDTLQASACACDTPWARRARVTQ